MRQRASVASKAAKKVALRAIKHDGATRKNLPTIENEAFLSEEVKSAKMMIVPRSSEALYPRNSDADPQLVWRGKDEQDADGDLAVKALPIYVHEHITPQHILQALADDALGRSSEPELFARDFNGLTDEQRLRFYEFDGRWTNRMILGDSLAVMASLSEKETLRGKVQVVYVDPPYGVNFRSNWQVATNTRDLQDGKAESISADPEQVRAFRDTWKDGVHSYLSYLRDRFVAARELLAASGSIFVQISEDNMHLVQCLLDEIFGSQNCVRTIIFTKAAAGLSTSDRVSSRTDFILWYAKDIVRLKYHPLYTLRDDPIESGFEHIRLDNGTIRSLTVAEKRGSELRPKGRLLRLISLTKPGPGSKYTIEVGGINYTSGSRWWGFPKETLERLIALGRVVPVGNTLRAVQYFEDSPARAIGNLWTDVTGARNPTYVVQTNELVIQRCLLMSSDPGDLVLDPTCGSGTTAFVAEQWGRRWITIDTSRVALMLARTRMMAARFDYYVLVDSHEGRLREAQLSGQPIPTDLPPALGNVAKGFVLSRAPHVTLKSIADNQLIRPGMATEEIEMAARRNAENTLFVDQPLIDKSAVRVAGPLTVESLSPTEARPLDFEADDTSATEHQDFVETVLDNVKTSGISNGEQGGRTYFESLEAFPGTYISAIGHANDGRKFAIVVGPREGTVDGHLIRAAGREAVYEAFADTMAVCGFAFDETAKTERLGKLLILKIRMNHDLQIADLLKKSKTANLFQVYGEPDVTVLPDGSGFRVQLHGMDVYDPSKREIRSAGTDRIQAWFLDTNYDGERFIVRHAYFLGDEEAFANLKRALKDEIDEDGWRSIHSAVSRPFQEPKTGRVAIKVITVYGDESLVVKDISKMRTPV